MRSEMRVGCKISCNELWALLDNQNQPKNLSNSKKLLCENQ